MKEKKQNNDVGGNRRADGGGTGGEEVGSRRTGVPVQPAVSCDSSLRALMRRTLLFNDNTVAREHSEAKKRRDETGREAEGGVM